MKYCIFIFCCLNLLVAAEIFQYKHPHESNINKEQIAEELKKFENIRQFNADSVPYYLKLVKYLFRKQRFRSDPRSDGYFIASIPLRINKQQYELLADSDISGLNIKEIDGLLEEVMKQSNNAEIQQSIASIMYEYYREEIISSITSFSSPILWIVLSLTTIIVCNKIFHFSKIKFISIIVISFALICGISFYMTYQDCMNEKEIEQLMALKDSAGNNPCKKYEEESENSLMAWFFGSKKNECKEYMKKTLSPPSKYCNPLEVFLKWLAKLHMSYFGSIFKEFNEFFSESTSSLDFISRSFSKIIYLAFFGITSIVIVVMIIKYFMQNIPNYIKSAASSDNQNDENSSIAILNAKMDAILKENGEIKREISVIRERSEEPQPAVLPLKKKHKLGAIKEAAKKKNESTDSSGYD